MGNVDQRGFSIRSSLWGRRSDPDVIGRKFDRDYPAAWLGKGRGMGVGLKRVRTTLGKFVGDVGDV